MYRTSTALAALTASLESHAEPIEPKVLKQPHGLEALDAAEAEQRLACVRYAMEQEGRRLEMAVELQHALESQADTLSPLQAEMANHVAKRVGLTMAHERHGFGMESYSGPRGRTMLRASTEGFKEWFKEFLAKLVKLWKRFVAWLKTFVDAKYIALRTIRQTLSSNYARTNLQHGNIWRGDSKLVLEQFSDTDGKLAVKELVNNTIGAFDSVCGDYLSKVHGYGQSVLDVAGKMIDAEGNLWRKLVDDVKHVQFPVPEGFVEEKANGNSAEYHSQLLVGRVTLAIETGRSEQMQGHRGMGEYTDALQGSKAKAYAQRRPPKEGLFGNIGDNLAWFDKHGDEVYRAIVELVDKAIASASRVRPFLKSSSDTLRAIEEMERKTVGDTAEKPQLSLAAKLLSSVQASDKVAAELLNNLLTIATNAGVAGQHLKIREK